MARVWFRNKQLTRQTLTGTITPASVLSLTFTPAASTNYWLLWSTQSDYTTTARQCNYALNDTTGAASLATPNNRTGNTANVSSVGGIAKWTSGGSPGSQQFDITHAPSNTADTVGSDDIFLIALKAEATDAYAEVLAADSTTSSTLSDKATLTFTPGSQGDYLILFSAEVGGLIPATTNGICRVLLDIDGVQYYDTVDGYQANSSGPRYAWAGALVVNLTAASHTLKIRYASSNNTDTANIRNTRVLAIRLDSFHNANTDQDNTEQSTSSTTFTAAATETSGARASDYLTLAAGLIRYSASARAMQAQIDVAGTGRSVNTRYQMSSAGTRKTSYIGFGYDTLVAASQTVEAQYLAALGTDTAYFTDAFVGAFLMDIPPHSFASVIG